MTAAPLLYLSSPYTHADPAVREERFRKACEVAGRMMARGHCVFSPIAHSHPIDATLPKTQGHFFWLRQDFAVLARCSRLLVLKLDGWESSRGIAAEVAFAIAHGIPVEHVDP